MKSNKRESDISSPQNRSQRSQHQKSQLKSVIADIENAFSKLEEMESLPVEESKPVSDLRIVTRELLQKLKAQLDEFN